MGQKIHPIGFRLGVTRGWYSRWFPTRPTDYARLVMEDYSVRELVKKKYGAGGGVSRVEVERNPGDITVIVNTARPGVIIGRGGQRVDQLKAELEAMTKLTVRLNIIEIRQPELDAIIVGHNIAEQLERRIAYRRAVRATMQRTMQAGALGIKVSVSGRLGGADIARTDMQMQGQVPLHTLRADIDFAISEAHTSYGIVGIKIWIYRGTTQINVEADEASKTPVRLSLGTPPIQQKSRASTTKEVTEESSTDASA